MNEWDSGIYPRVNLTSKHLTWDPSNPSYAEQEDSMTGFCSDIVVNDPAANGHAPLVITLSVLWLLTKQISLTTVTFLLCLILTSLFLF